MGEIKNIVVKILRLIIDIFLLGMKVIKQLVLPNKYRSGNIISSLLVFFIGLVDRLYLFEHGFFKMGNLFRLQYVRRTVVIIAGILFILASFECRIQVQNNFIGSGAEIEFISTIIPAKYSVKHQLKSVNRLVYLNTSVKGNLSYSEAFISPIKKYLQTHSLLI